MGTKERWSRDACVRVSKREGEKRGGNRKRDGKGVWEVQVGRETKAACVRRLARAAVPVAAHLAPRRVAHAMVVVG
eukprot:2182264-Pleurochrysis_carterae.AAC.3